LRFRRPDHSPRHLRPTDQFRSLLQAPQTGRVWAKASLSTASNEAEQLARQAPTAAFAPPLRVEFEVPVCEVAFGDSVVIVGDAPELGGWDPYAGLPLQWGEGHNWTAHAELPSGYINFKVGGWG
jgi:hypothetical protein